VGKRLTKLASSDQLPVKSVTPSKNPNGTGTATIVAGPHEGVSRSVPLITSAAVRETHERRRERGHTAHHTRTAGKKKTTSTQTIQPAMLCSLTPA
jgi:hypothetical protein